MPKTTSNFPTSLDTTLSSDRLSGDVITSDSYDILEDGLSKVEQKIGIDNSAVATSIDYQLNNLLSATTHSGSNVYAATVSATNISATNVKATLVTATNLSSTNAYVTTVVVYTTLSGTDVKVTTVTATNVSAASISATTISATTYVGAISYSYAATAGPLTASGRLSAAHGLGARPAYCQGSFVCLTADYDYAAGDEIFIGPNYFETSNNRYYSLAADATNWYWNFASTALAVMTKNIAGSGVAMTMNKWGVRVRLGV
jgi:hypothetical protein